MSGFRIITFRLLLLSVSSLVVIIISWYIFAVSFILKKLRGCVTTTVIACGSEFYSSFCIFLLILTFGLLLILSFIYFLMEK